MDTIREVCKLQRRDQDLCSVMLELLGCLVPHLSVGEDAMSASLERIRDLALQLLSIFW